MERRGFLKTLAGAGLGAGMLSAWGAATPAQAAGLEDCLAVVVDVDACTGCGACVQACHERAAVRGADGGALLVKKQAGGGVTLALAARAFAPDWEWTE